MEPLYNSIRLSTLLPEIILVVAGCAVLLVSQAQRDALRRAANWVALLAILVAALLIWAAPSVVGSTGITTGSGLVYDPLAGYVRISTLILGFLIALVNWSQARDSERGEFLSMMLFSLAGLLLVGAADDLVTLFLALELVSIPTYIMVALSRTRRVALEAATKYFYLGALSAAIMAYGFTFLYGVSGTTEISGSIAAVSDALTMPGTLPHALASLGLLLAFGGLLFKIAAVPMHFYIADVYQGAASSVAGLLGFVPKLAGIVAIFRLMTLAEWQTLHGGLFWLLWIVAAVTMTVGNMLALQQTNIKRMLAYSGIAHSGYMLVGILAGPVGARGALLGDGAAAVLYYVVIYGIANLGAFAVLALLRVRGGACETLRDVAGLLRRNPALALLLALAMFTLMGLPPTPGFWGKLSIFGSALAAAKTAGGAYESWLIALVVIGVLNSAMAAAYYLRVIAAVLLYENEEPASAVSRDAVQMGALLCGLMLLIFTFRPADLLNRGRDATFALRNSVAPSQSRVDHSAPAVAIIEPADPSE